MSLSHLPAVLEALEEQVVVLKLLFTARDLGEVQVSIGEKNEDEDSSKIGRASCRERV